MASAFTNEAYAQKVFKLRKAPKELAVEYALKVEVIQSNKDEIHIFGNSKELKRFEFKEINDKLVLTRKRSNIIFSDRKDQSINVKLYLRDVNRIKSYDISGASKVIVIEKVNAPSISVDLSGASKLDISLSTDELFIDTSGASSIIVDGSSQKIDLEQSGASSTELSGEFGIINADLSGASGLKINGKGDEIILDLSGASNFNGKNCYFKSADLEVSGASSASIKAGVVNSDTSGRSTVKVLK